MLALAGNIAAITFAFDLPWTAAFIYGVYDLYAYFTAGNIADLRTAEADPVLWADVTCAIYNAIKADGQVTAGNCGAVIAALCALTYTPAVAVTAICAFVTQLGCDGLRSAQVAGVLTTFNCGPCTTGPWCYGWTGASVNMPPWQLVPGDPNTDPSGVFAFSGGAIISKTYGGSRQLHLYMTYPLSTNITQIEVRYSCPEAAGVGSRFVAWEASGAHHGLAGGAGTNVATFAVTANDGYLEIELDSAPAILGQNTITAVYINGTGPCPFGIPNC